VCDDGVWVLFDVIAPLGESEPSAPTSCCCFFGRPETGLFIVIVGQLYN